MYRKVFVAAVMIFAMTVTVTAQGDQQVVKPTEGMTIEPVLCAGIEDRMPVGETDKFPADVEKVYLWTKVTGVSEGETVIHHVWLREGVEMADVPLPVKGSPWRTYSYKTIPPEWAGNWEVKIAGADGNVIKSIQFTVGGKAEEKPAETP